MRHRIAAIALAAAALALTGCSAQPSPSGGGSETDHVIPDDLAYVAAVHDDWGDCLADLGATGAMVFTAGGSEMKQVGVVTTTYTDGTLSWDVGVTNSDTIFTLPSDDSTTNALATVGC